MMKKKVVALLLVTVMLLGCLTGCGGKDKRKGGDSTLTVGIPQRSTVSDYDDNAFTKYVEEKLGMELEFVYFSSEPGEYKQQLTLATGAGEELPDVLWGFTDLGRSTINQFGEDGYFIDLTDLIEKHAVNYKNQLSTISEAERNLIKIMGTNSSNGCFYGMPTYTSSMVADYMQNMMTINQEWLDKVGMTAPTNVDELYSVLKAFKTKDPNGNGQDDEVPILSSDIMYYIINAYVYYNYTYPYNVTDGKVWNPVATNEYRQALIYLNKLYKEELFSSLNLTATFTDIKNLVSGSGSTARVGIWSGHPLNLTTSKCEILDEYVALAPLGDATGKGGYGVQQPNYLVYGGFITKDCEDTEAAMKFFDLFYLDETAMRLRHGEKDVDWEEGTGTSYYGTEAIIRVINPNAVLEGSQTWGNTGTTFMNPKNNLAISVAGVGREAEIGRLCGEHMDNMNGFKRPTERIEYLAYNDDEQAIRDELEKGYSGYVHEARCFFINGDLDPSSDKDWNDYLKQLEKYGASKLLEITQSAYDSYTKK